MTATVFEREIELPVTADEAFAWHARPGALDRLIPPWERVKVLSRGAGIQDDSVVELEQRLGPLRLKWIAKHHGYKPGREFRDTQVAGPFRCWEHTHQFRPNGIANSALVDRIEYRIPGGLLGGLLGGQLVNQKVAHMFDYRHNTTRDDLAAHAKYRKVGIMQIAVTGASGLVGSSLVPLFTTGGHEVLKLVRNQAGEGELRWDPARQFDASGLDGIDAVVHLAGESIASARWSDKVKRKISNSRVEGTRLLCEGLAEMKSPPKTLVCASAIGFYGNRGDEKLSEDSEPGEGFLAEVAREWEAATQPAADAGIRVVNLRFGVIVSPKGGALAKMLLLFMLGGGGRVGSGKQYWSWISIDDAVGAVHHALMTDSLAGPVNVVSPHPVTNAEFTKTLGSVLKRPTIVPVPAFAARLSLGEMAEALLLASTRVVPTELIRTGYDFRQPTLEEALRHVLGRTR